MKKKRLFWHVHHDKLAEWSDNIDERKKYIKKFKPKNEVKRRLKLMKPLEGIPKHQKEAYRKWKEADRKWKEAYRKWKEAYRKWEEADRKWKEAYIEIKPKLEKLHKKECGCREWDGEILIFE